jgi:hypothetical protein
MRIDVSNWEVAGEEPQGLEKHPWLRHESRARPWLFKGVDIQEDRPLADDVVEKLASEVAHAIGIPAARVALVTRDSFRGCLVETLRPSKWDFYAGQVLVGALVDDYDPKDSEHRGHSVTTVRRALDGFGPPPGFDATAHLSAFEVFAGYLLFDALIANTDRHDRNWAVLVPPPGRSGPNTLCGSYDHASGLGFNLSDGRRQELLDGRSIAQFASRAAARQFEHIRGAPRRTLLDVAMEALSLCSAAVRIHWRRAILSVERDQLEAIGVMAPDLTDITRRFIIELLTTNRRRVLDALS